MSTPRPIVVPPDHDSSPKAKRLFKKGYNRNHSSIANWHEQLQEPLTKTEELSVWYPYAQNIRHKIACVLEK